VSIESTQKISHLTAFLKLFSHTPKASQETKTFETQYLFSTGGDIESLPFAIIIHDALEWRDKNQRLAYLVDNKYGFGDYFYLTRLYENILLKVSEINKNITIADIRKRDISASGYADYISKFAWQLSNIKGEENVNA